MADDKAVSVTVVGIGPGDAQMVTLQGREALAQASLVAGFSTVLEVVKPWLDHAEVCPMTYRNQEEVLDYAIGQARQGRACVVCCWGDLNVSARELLERVRRRVDHVQLIPGISSIQVALARSGISLEETLFITLHQRKEAESDLEELVHYLKEGRRHIILLPRPFDLMPPVIARGLLEEGIPAGRPVTIFQRLTMAGEEEWSGTLEDCAAISRELSDLSIMVFPHSPGSISAGQAG
ncbi:MAG: precorrin-6y C5,15-methyltransferase (decarboxylating) subunit CbiE [Chloroflexi bacterium]|nr:precorrin-6y C5,15-methyltransferase (decarboxylating) subunit CbiE [Chloroflexota bacterium]